MIGILCGRSDVLSLDICVRDELELRLYDPVRGEWLMYYQEVQDALQAERAAREAAEAERQAKITALQDERTARQAAEQRIRELEAQLTRRQNNDSS